LFALHGRAGKDPILLHRIPGHSELYLVIPIREWDDAQAVSSVGGAKR
jgi:hypothetical protein